MHSKSLMNSKNNKCKQNNKTYYNQTVKILKRNPKSKRREIIQQYTGPSKDDELILLTEIMEARKQCDDIFKVLR